MQSTNFSSYFQTNPVFYRTSELKEGVENLFSLLDWMEHSLSINKNVNDWKYAVAQEKIIGGREAKEGAFPFIASLKIKNYNRLEIL